MTLKSMFIRKEDPIPFTKEGYEVLQKEYKALLSERPEAVDHLKKAREMGDLSENGYYKASRSRLSFLDKRIRMFARLIRLAVIIEKKNDDTVHIGSTITITDGEETYTYTIVGGYESDPEKKTISHLSPIGKAFIGKKVNDICTVIAPKRTSAFTLLKIS